MGGVPTLTLNTGTTIPQPGLGTARVTDQEEIRRIVREAIEVGYRHVDTAAKYDNEVGVGRGLADSGVDRADLFVTTKLRGSEQGEATTREALTRSLDRLGLDHVDLYLAVNQIELHPRFPQREQRADPVGRGIVTVAWSPLANANDPLRANLDVFDFVLDEKELRQIAGLETGKRVADQDPRTWEEF